MLTILEVQETELIRLRATFSPLAKRRLEEMESLKTISNSSTYPKEQVCMQLFTCCSCLHIPCTLCFPRGLIADETVCFSWHHRRRKCSYTNVAHCWHILVVNPPLRTHACYLRRTYLYLRVFLVTHAKHIFLLLYRWLTRERRSSS